MAGAGQTILKLGTFFDKYVLHSMPIFENKSHPIRPVEGLKLFLDFLCNTDIEIVWPAPATPRSLTVKGVYEVSYSWYGHIFESVSMFCLI